MRWLVTAYYRTDAGIIDVDHEIDELSDLHDLIEQGPSWYSLDRIEIRTAIQTGQTIEATLAE
jgi:hypothetical protein